MKFIVFLLALSIYLAVAPIYNGWYAMNLKEKVKFFTEKTFKPVLKGGKWIKDPGFPVYVNGKWKAGPPPGPESFLTYDFSIEGKGLNFKVFRPDSMLKFEEINEYDKNGQVTAARQLENKSLLTKDVFTSVYRNIIVLEAKRYDQSNHFVQTITNQIDNSDNIIHTQIRDETGSKKIRYETWMHYDQQRDLIMKVQSRAPDYRKDTTTILYLKFDATGNWIQRVEKTKLSGRGADYDQVLLLERAIKYY